MSRRLGSRSYVQVVDEQREEEAGVNLVLLNHGADDEMECKGYRDTCCRSALFWLLVVLTGGVLLLICRWRPEWRVKLSKRQCSLRRADTVLLKDQAGDLCPEPVIIKQCEGPTIPIEEYKYTGAEVEGDSYDDTTALTQQQHFFIKFFEHRHVRYIWIQKSSCFRKLQGLDDGDLTCADLHDHHGDGLTPEDSKSKLSLFGENKIKIDVKSYFRLFIEEVLNPFYIFQICSIILWSLDDYYIYAVCIFVISGISLGIELYETRKQRVTLRDMVGSTESMVTVCRGSSDTEEVLTCQLAPGDVMLVPAHGCMMMCDAVLLSGNAIVNESMLTGESVPVTKTPLSPTEASEVFSPDTHKRHVLFCGTKVIQTRYYTDTRVKAVVIRTGFQTAKGELVRSILYPKPTGFKFYQDAMKFILLLALFAVLGMTYSIVMLQHNGAHVGRIVLRALDIITIIVPPALPAAMTVGTVYAQSRLKKQGIFCISPARINVCGKLKLICFDKTGTLTEDGLDLWGIVCLKNNRFLPHLPDPSSLPSRDPFVIAMATCHSLTMIDGSLTGDPLDLKMFESTNWILEEPGRDTSRFDTLVPTIVRPVSQEAYYCENQSQGQKITRFMCDCCETPFEVGIVRQFPFSSAQQRMSVITRNLGARNMDLYCKGAPEKVSALCRPETMPLDFHDVLKRYTMRGFRVIAAAWRPLDKKLTWHQAQRVARDTVECDLLFLGLIILENMLKPQTTPVIHQLKHAKIRTVMVTGDNILTAISVARQCGMVEAKEAVVQVDAYPPDGDKPARILWQYADIDSQTDSEEEAQAEDQMSDDSAEQSMAQVMSPLYQAINVDSPPDQYYHFAVSGRSFTVLRHHFPDLIERVVVRGAVFARMSPDQKTQLVESLQNLGYCVGMCGDGANDCGALKTAHAGISLSEAEASVASPFTSRTANIECVPTVIKEGRAALVTSFGVFKYMALYSFVQFVSVLILYTKSTNLGDGMFLYIDLIITTTVAVLMGHTGAFPKLVAKRPPGSLVAPSNVFSLTVHILIVALVQMGAYFYLTMQPWFRPTKTNPDASDSKCHETTVIFIVSSFQYILLAFVFSKGPPYRKRIWTNAGFLVSLLILMALTVLILLHPFPFMLKLLSMLPFPEGAMKFQLTLLSIVGIHFLLAFIMETFISESSSLKKCANCIRQKKVPKNKYKFINQELLANHNWPPMGETTVATVDSLYIHR